MQTPGLFFVTDSDRPAGHVAPLLERVLACWQPAHERLDACVLSTRELLTRPGQLDRGGVVWLMLEAPDSARPYELLETIHKRHVPALLTRSDETRPLGAVQQEGVTICPPGTDANVCCAMLQTLASQSDLIRSLNGELRLIRSGSGGLFDRMSKIDEELRLAAQLQQQFLPTRLPAADDISVNALWRPAHYVSGDIYDATRLDENHIGLFLADAVGHGVPAALMTMYIKRSLHTKQIDDNADGGDRLLEPAEALAHLNRDMMAAQNEHVHFATGVYGVLDCRSRELTLANAGHPAPMLLRRGGEIEYFQPDGGLLGVFEQTFEQTTVRLDRGDRLLLYSDGFELAFPRYDETGRKVIATDQYAEEFARLRAEEAETALHRLNHRLDAQRGSLEQRDDLTVLSLTVHEPASINGHAAADTVTEKQRASPKAALNVSA